MDKVRLTAAQEHLERLNRAIAKDAHETHKRVTRCTGLDGDSDYVSRKEWSAHYERVALLGRYHFD
jgi:hypothetical protein